MRPAWGSLELPRMVSHRRVGARDRAALLAAPPDPGDPLTAQVRVQRAGVQVLRAVAWRKRPLMLFLDDLLEQAREQGDVTPLVQPCMGHRSLATLSDIGRYRR
jgi:hypothetical protein